MWRRTRLVRSPKEQVNALMNLNFCVRWLRQIASGMSRTNIIALLIFGAILGYFLSFGPDSTRKFQAGIYQLLAPFLSSGSGIQKQITSVRSGLKSLDELEKENSGLRVENRELRATNQGLRDVEREVNRLRHALNYRERSVFKLLPAVVIARDSSTWWRTNLNTER